MQFRFPGKKEEKKKEIRYILTIDGGGMRGIVPACIIKEMNEELKKRTARPLYSFFDLVAGTSTGALIALGLTSPVDGTSLRRESGDDYRVERKYLKGRFFKKEYTETLGYISRLSDPENFVNLYKEHGTSIFLKKEARGFKKVINIVNRFFSDKYDIAPYEEFLSSLYGDVPLSSALVPTMAVSYNLDNGEKFVFRSWDSRGYLIREAARASSAAPTYFAPARFIDRVSGEELTLADGGLIANNPILAAYIEAVHLYPDADEYRFLSLSTASASFSMKLEDVSNNFDWMGPLLGAYSAANMKISLEGVEAVPNVKVLRVWENVLKTHLKLDDTSETAVKALEEAAGEIWAREKEQISAFLDEMTALSNIPDHLVLQDSPSRERIEDKSSLSLSLPSL